MRKRLLHPLAIGALLALLLPASAFAQPAKPAATVPKPAASAPLAALCAAYWNEQARLFPLAATAEGKNRYTDQFPNVQTQAFRGQLRVFYQTYQTRLRKTDRQVLNAQDQTSCDILNYDLANKRPASNSLSGCCPSPKATA